MKIIIDTNVLVSGLVWGGKPGEVIELTIEANLEVFATENMMHEYFRILEKLKKTTPL